MKSLIFFFLALFLAAHSIAQTQTGGIRGNVFDKASGQPVPFVNVYIQGTTIGASTDMEGFFTITNAPVGECTLCTQYLGYDSLCVKLNIERNKMTNQNLTIAESSETIKGVEVDGVREQAQNEVRVSVISITPRDINRIPAIGGKTDFAQFLQTVPGVIFSGDQGGQFYIRGGAPIQNKILLDGMPIYNAFHSIGFFSVFETDIIRSADIYTGGFGAQYGGRSSAVVDIRTRDGNKKRFSGNICATPFVSSFLFEGPIVKLREDKGNSISFLLTGKHSYLRQVSKVLYPYANEQGVLPYNFTDLYGKVSFNTANGTRVNAFGFTFSDNTKFTGLADYSWLAGGGGLDFRIIPGTAKILMDGNINYSAYKSNFIEGSNSKSRYSKINSFAADFNFTYFLANSGQFNYGLELTSFYTDFSFTNNQGIPAAQAQSNTEVAAYFRYKGRFGNLVIDPSFRGHFYASLGEFRAEPRLGLKYNITKSFRLKAAGGLYSQNLISSVDERDIVNLFVGFLGGPESGVYKYKDGVYTQTKSRLQTSIHAIGGIEANIGKSITINVEPYIKWFPQIISLNRNRVKVDDPVYIAEKGTAYGTDLAVKYDKDQLYVSLGYSLSYVKRNDGVQTYYASFDRRHNANFVASYEFNIAGKKKQTLDTLNINLDNNKKTKYPFEVSLRWNLGSGFPFTQTQGFYQWQTFADGITTNYLNNNNSPNTQLGIIYDKAINGGRLPYYHRLDFSFKYTTDITKYVKLQFAASLTNMYNRQNIFYFDRVRYTRVNQLPILPAASITLKF